MGSHAAPVAQVGRWAHLPGGGLGPVQPSKVGRARVWLLALVKPVLIVGFCAGALLFAVREVPGLMSFTGFAPDPVPAVTAPAGKP